MNGGILDPTSLSQATTGLAQARMTAREEIASPSYSRADTLCSRLPNPLVIGAMTDYSLFTTPPIPLVSRGELLVFFNTSKNEVLKNMRFWTRLRSSSYDRAGASQNDD